MPTRSGWTTLAASLSATLIGRVFGILELFVIGAGLAIAVVVAVAGVRLRRPDLAVTRWAHPAVLSVGEVGRVDLLIDNRATFRSPRVDLTEPVGTMNAARMTIAPLGSGEQVTAGYRVPATRRGVLDVGPAVIERRDRLGLAVRDWATAGVTEITVAPRTLDLSMPALGHGSLGRHLLAVSQRIGAGEFHSLRDYVTGDEPRSIHWKASARSEGLKVRQHEAQGVRRCIVVLDRAADAHPIRATDPEEFERAVTIAASLVVSAERSGLTTRFVTGGGVDLRGPDVATHTLQVLARLQPGAAPDELERDPSEGLGLLVVVTPTPGSDAWRLTGRIADPTMTRVGVFTAQAQSHPSAPATTTVDAATLPVFLEAWRGLTGSRRAIDPRDSDRDRSPRRDDVRQPSEGRP